MEQCLRKNLCVDCEVDEIWTACSAYITDDAAAGEWDAEKIHCHRVEEQDDE